MMRFLGLDGRCETSLHHVPAEIALITINMVFGMRVQNY